MATSLSLWTTTIEAFVVAPKVTFRTSSSSKSFLSSSIVTGPTGKAAQSFEEDLLLTLQIIRDHESRSATVSTEQFVQQVEKAAALDAAAASIPEVAAAATVVDLSIPYDAAAKLAYSAVSNPTVDYLSFKAQYEAEAVASVTAKKAAKASPPAAASSDVVDLSIPYDAAAKLAYAALSTPNTDYLAFKAQYETEAVASVTTKRWQRQPPEAAAGVVDLSIPYDAAARLAFAAATDKTLSFDQFKVDFEAKAVQEVVAKRQLQKT